MPKFLTLSGFFSWICTSYTSIQRPTITPSNPALTDPSGSTLTEARGVHTLFKLTISPFAFLIFRSLAKKYQNLLLATTSLGAKMRMR